MRSIRGNCTSKRSSNVLNPLGLFISSGARMIDSWYEHGGDGDDDECWAENEIIEHTEKHTKR